jgi:uncharacterized protein (TIGR03435 family)
VGAFSSEGGFAVLKVGRTLLRVNAIWLVAAVLSFFMLAQAGASQTEISAPGWEIAAGGTAQFAVATVKPSVPGTPFGSNVSLDGADGPPAGSLFRANAPLMAYLLFAFKISDSNQARGIYDKLPAWAKAPQFFQVEGRADGNPTRDQLRLMVQALLADRFELKIHREMQPRVAYVLVLDRPEKEGPQLRPHPADKTCVNNPTTSAVIGAPAREMGAPYYCGMVSWNIDGERHLQIVDMTMAQVANYLASQAVLATAATVPHSGVDNTGLTGRFDVQLQFVPESGEPDANSDIPGPRFIDALKSQLGLRFAEKTVPVEVIVVDHLEKPSLEN